MLTPLSFVPGKRRETNTRLITRNLRAAKCHPDPHRADVIRALGETLPKCGIAAAGVWASVYAVQHGEAVAGAATVVALARYVWARNARSNSPDRDAA